MTAPDVVIVSASLHCGACGARTTLTGADTTKTTALWMSAHYRPFIDAITARRPDGGLDIWQRRSTP